MLADDLPSFNEAVHDGGYRWWYVDGLSDCGTFGIVIIAFVGSVFSPYYYRARQRGPGVAEEHCAINVALYLPKGKHWAMTERGAGQTTRTADRLQVAGSAVSVQGDQLTVDIDEFTVPWPRRLRGKVTVTTSRTNATPYPLDPDGRHTWQPVSPESRIAVNIDRPGIHWEGDAYVDSNGGTRPLEADFRVWDWSRIHRADGTHITYNVIDWQDQRRSLALHSTASGIETESVATPIKLRRSGWGIDITTTSDEAIRVERFFEDTPFYARSLLAIDDGENMLTGVHECLSLERFTKPWVRAMLPFRMPRIAF